MTAVEPVMARCSAISNRTGEQCRRSPILGGTVCPSHGGRAPQVKAAARRRVQAQKAALHVSKFAEPVEVGHMEALVGELHLAQGIVNWLTALISSFGSADELKQLDVTSRFEKPSVWVEMLGNERDRLLRAAKACADVGVEERWLDLERSQGEQFATTIGGILADVFRELLAGDDLSIEMAVRIQREKVPEILRRRLTEVAGGGT